MKRKEVWTGKEPIGSSKVLYEEPKSEMFFKNILKLFPPSRTLLTSSTTTEKNFIISMILVQSNMQRDACYRLHSSKLYL